MTGYDDIISHPHHESKKHPRMPRIDRAAQFAPFAALTGYESAIKETERLTQEKIILSEEARNELDEKLRYILESSEEPEAEITYFVEDKLKEGGSYKTTKCIISAIESNKLILKDGKRIPIENIINIIIPNMEPYI